MAPNNVAAVLAEAFARTGSQALPYATEFVFMVQQHLTDLVADLPTLQVKAREYTHSDGRSATLLVAEGTVPMYYQGVKYNIPVAAWLPEAYPLAPPLAYVVPTPNMVIKAHHAWVDPSGLVRSPYIAQWQYPASNLREMAQDMSMLFGSDPPLFSKSAAAAAAASSSSGGSAAAQQQQQQQQQQAAYNGGGAGAQQGDDAFHAQNPLTAGSQAVGGAAAGAAAGAGFSSVWGAALANEPQQNPPPQQQPPQQQQPRPPASAVLPAAAAAAGVGAAAAAAAQQQQQQQSPQMSREAAAQKLSSAFRAAAAATLNRRLQASLTAEAAAAAAEAAEQLQLRGTLRERGERLQAELSALQEQAERSALDALSHDLATANAQLDRWLLENERLAAAADDPSQLDPDAIILVADPLSQQALEVQAQDLALDDALTALDEALRSGGLELDAYLKQVRAVSRRQFFVRTLGNKVAVAQQQQQEQQRHQRPQQQQQQQAPRPGGAPGGVQRTLSAGRPVSLPVGDSWARTGLLPPSGGGGGGGGGW